MGFKVFVTHAALFAALLPSVAGAALGGNVESVQADRAQMKALSLVTDAAQFKIHEIQTPSGTAVREFVSPGGEVFAVAWEGPEMPDLRQLLGQYFDQYVSAAKSAHTGRTHLELQQPNLVVQSGGHMHSFAGRAWVPSLLPQGLALDEIH